MSAYVVIENTPGYLPEDDDSAVFEDEQAAREYLRERVEDYCEWFAGDDGEYPDVSHDDEWSWAHVTDPDPSSHHLGRVFEIMECEAS